MSWHRFRVMRFDDNCTGENFTCRRIDPRKSALKKPCGDYEDCKRKTNNNIFRASTKCNEYKNKKACTFKPCEPSPVLHSTTFDHPPSCSGDRTRNKRINTDYIFVPGSDFRITKKRTRFTEAAGVRSPCSILSLQSKHCQGNPYIIYCPEHSGVCDCRQNEAEASRANARSNKNRRRKISTEACPRFFKKPTCNESTIYSPDTTACANDFPRISDKALVYRKCRNTKSKKKLKNKKTGGDACMCHVDATTSTNGKSGRSKIIKPRTRECCPYKWNPTTCASHDDPCCKYYVDEATNTKDKSGCSQVRPRIDNVQTSNCCQNTCPDPCVDLVDEATGTNDKTGCAKIIRPRIPGCQTRMPKCQKLPIISDCQHSKWSKIIRETCDEPAECHVDEAVGTNDKSGCLKIVRPRIPSCQILTPAIPECQISQGNKIRSHTCTDHCEFYKDSATDTLNKAGCFKVIRPRLRECRKPKWYDKLKKKSRVGCDFYKDVSTSTKPKSRCSKSKVIRPRIHECQYSRWNCLGKTKPCTCCVDNSEICKCQQFKWKKMFRRKSKPCIAGDPCSRKPECQKDKNPCIRYVNLEDECGRAVSPLYGVSEQCIENSCQTALTQAREIMIKSTAVTSTTSKLFLGSSNKRDPFGFQCRTDPCRETFYEHPRSRRANCGVVTSPSLLHTLLNRRKPCASCSRPCVTQQCLRWRLFNCLEHLMMGTVAVCCAPCFLIAISYWFVCYLFTNDCKKADETFGIPYCRDARVQGGSCKKIERKCLDDDQICYFKAPPGYTIETYNDKTTSTGCLPSPCTKVLLTCNDEENICKKKNKIRISKRCKKKSCPNPQRKYNLYYVDDRGWVIKPIPDGICGGGDNNLNPDTCSSPKRIICDRVNYDQCCNRAGPNKCSPQKTLICERLNYEDPCCNSEDPDTCPSKKVFCERVNSECDYEDCADPLCPPQSTEEQDPSENTVEPETVIYCEGANYQAACCSSPDPNCPPQNRFFCERVNFQDPCANCYYCTTSKDRRIRSRQPWRPNDHCICVSDCECPKIYFWKWMFSKSKTGNKSQMQGISYQKTKLGNSYQKDKMKSPKNGSGYSRPKMRSEYNNSKWGGSYQKSKLGSGDNRSIMGRDYRRSNTGRSNPKSKVGRTYQKSKMRMLSVWCKFNRADEKFRSETEEACREMVKDIVQLQPSMKQTLGEFSRSVLRIFKYILVSCCCCPVFFCFYCCHACCYRMYCNVFC